MVDDPALWYGKMRTHHLPDKCEIVNGRKDSARERKIVGEPALPVAKHSETPNTAGQKHGHERRIEETGRDP